MADFVSPMFVKVDEDAYMPIGAVRDNPDLRARVLDLARERLAALGDNADALGGLQGSA